MPAPWLLFGLRELIVAIGKARERRREERELKLRIKAQIDAMRRKEATEMDFLQNVLLLKFIPKGYLTAVSAWALVAGALVCWSPTLAAAFPFIDCKVVAGVAGGTGLIGLRRALETAKK